MDRGFLLVAGHDEGVHLPRDLAHLVDNGLVVSSHLLLEFLYSFTLLHNVSKKVVKLNVEVPKVQFGGVKNLARFVRVQKVVVST